LIECFSVSLHLFLNKIYDKTLETLKIKKVSKYRKVSIFAAENWKEDRNGTKTKDIT
jgi:hypothetical protein